VLSLDGFAVNRDDLWQLEYYLQLLAPKPSGIFTVRGPSGEVRKEQVLTKYIDRKRIKDLTVEAGLIDNYKLDFEDEKIGHSLRSRYVEHDDVMIWKMPSFAPSDSEIDHLVDVARKHRALILDLRDDPGGYVETLSHMIGSFFGHDVNICTRVTRKDQKLQIAKSLGKKAYTGDLVVLVDSRSASAAEIFARVMQLEHRGAVLGDHTSGSVMEALHFLFSTGVDIKVFYGASITTADVIMADGKGVLRKSV
jgi:C-terminal processing protease CtpA/Prc